MSPGVESILKMSDFRVMKSYFEVRPEAESFDKTETHLSLDVAVLQSNEAENDMAVQVTVDLNQSADHYRKAGFTGSIAITGFFDVAALKEGHSDDWESMLVYNAVTVLFGSVRTIYADLSSASPVGRIVIPTVNVGEILRAKSLEPAPAGKAKK